MMKAQACGLESLELGNASAIGVLLLITVFMVRAWGIGQPECMVFPGVSQWYRALSPSAIGVSQ